ncbi:MAG: hypothetical protein K2I29_02765, partial [Clostridia bacterium]|nr:hypothetical protein [Clostridia bacterium]
YNVTSVTQSTDDGEANTTDITYEHGLPVEVKSGNTVIEYAYDFKGRKTKVIINGDEQLSTDYGEYSYDEESGECVFESQTSTCIVNDEETVTVTARKKGALDEVLGIFKVTEELKINSDDILCKNYDVKERLTDVSDFASQTFTEYTYNDFDNLIKAEAAKDGATCFTETLDYTGFGALSAKEISSDDCLWNYSYSYKDNAAHTLESISFGNIEFKPLTDVYSRNIGKKVYNCENKIFGEYVTYKKVGDHATNMPATVWFGSGAAIKDSIKYKYDNCGNICEVKENGHVAAKYTYDGLNRLVREDNKQIGKTVLYSYDNNGNITERCEFEYTAKSGEELSELECEHTATNTRATNSY